MSARLWFNYNYLQLSKENVSRNMMLSHWSCFTWKFFMIWFHKILKLILKAVIMPYKYMHWTLKKTTYITWQFSWTFIYTLSLRAMTILLNMRKKFCWIYYCCWPCHDVVTRSKMSCADVGSDVMTTLLSDVIKTLSQRCCNVVSIFSIGFLGYFTTDLFWFLSLHRNVRELPTC